MRVLDKVNLFMNHVGVFPFYLLYLNSSLIADSDGYRRSAWSADLHRGLFYYSHSLPFSMQYPPQEHGCKEADIRCGEEPHRI